MKIFVVVGLIGLIVGLGSLGNFETFSNPPKQKTQSAMITDKLYSDWMQKQKEEKLSKEDKCALLGLMAKNASEDFKIKSLIYCGFSD